VKEVSRSLIFLSPLVHCAPFSDRNGYPCVTVIRPLRPLSWLDGVLRFSQYAVTLARASLPQVRDDPSRCSCCSLVFRRFFLLSSNAMAALSRNRPPVLRTGSSRQFYYFLLSRTLVAGLSSVPRISSRFLFEEHFGCSLSVYKVLQAHDSPMIFQVVVGGNR